MLMKFHKYHGLGNDFIFVEDFQGSLISKGGCLAEELCHRQFGIGADGLVLIVGDANAYTMRVFNSDGTEAEMCGNAIRCMADYLLKNGLKVGTRFVIGTLSGPKEIEVDGDSYIVDMGHPDFSFNGGNVVEIKSHGVTWSVHPVSMGNPHGVVFVEDLDSLDFFAWGPRLEQAPVWPHKCNIDFTEVVSPKHLRVRVWERGAGPTLACGTGASAATVVAARQGFVNGKVQVSLPGGDLQITWEKDKQVFMAGPATKVFTGVIQLDQNLKRGK